MHECMRGDTSRLAAGGCSAGVHRAPIYDDVVGRNLYNYIVVSPLLTSDRSD